MMTYTVHIYCSKHGTSEAELLKMAYNYDYGKVMTAQKQQLPSVPSNDG